ncbi:hypothetical protein SpCBS45565_g01681 [Spizellomyces sp. 'palustris']|nr:hypothetical protein SpCBS45565_g01681 [Spizellomyces sp. 'palustris']
MWALFNNYHNRYLLNRRDQQGNYPVMRSHDLASAWQCWTVGEGAELIDSHHLPTRYSGPERTCLSNEKEQDPLHYADFASRQLRSDIGNRASSNRNQEKMSIDGTSVQCVDRRNYYPDPSAKARKALVAGLQASSPSSVLPHVRIPTQTKPKVRDSNQPSRVPRDKPHRRSRAPKPSGKSKKLRKITEGKDGSPQLESKQGWVAVDNEDMKKRDVISGAEPTVPGVTYEPSLSRVKLDSSPEHHFDADMDDSTPCEHLRRLEDCASNGDTSNFHCPIADDEVKDYAHTHPLTIDVSETSANNWATRRAVTSPAPDLRGSTTTSSTCSLSSVSFAGSKNTSEGTDVYNSVKDLSSSLWQMAKTEALQTAFDEELHPDCRIPKAIFAQSLDLKCRSHLARHPAPAPSIMARSERMLGSQWVARESHRLDPRLLDVPLDGLVPFMFVEDQLKLLKIQEKTLIVKRWKQLWDEVRPPQPYWYELRTPQFQIEAKKCLEMLSSPELQHLEAKVREYLIDLYRSEMMDRAIQPFHGDLMRV